MFTSCAFFLTLLLSTFTTTLPTPTTLLSPITKDPTTLQYTLLLHLQTPLLPTNLVPHLSSSFLWHHCPKTLNSSSPTPLPCDSPLCTTTTHTCTNHTCTLFPSNPITHKTTPAAVRQTPLALPATDGRNPGPLAKIPNFPFSCSPTTLLKGLPKHALGIAPLSPSILSLPSQICSSLFYPRKFAICLSGSPSAPGLAFFGEGPYIFLPEIDISRTLTYAPLINHTETTHPNPNHFSDGRFYDEYFVGVKSIRVNDKKIKLNSSLILTKFSTVVPYTTLDTSIYKPLSSAFITEAATMNVTRVGPMKPFKVCFSSMNVKSTRVGLAVPTIDLVFERESVFWRVFGANSMVQVEEDIVCLGFLDGGLMVGGALIVVGGYQMEDNMVEFDVEKERVGFSSSLLFRETACANFNFTYKPYV